MATLPSVFALRASAMFVDANPPSGEAFSRSVVPSAITNGVALGKDAPGFSASVPSCTSMPPVNAFGPESVSAPSPFFTRPPAPASPLAIVTSYALETVNPPAPIVGVGTFALAGRKSVAAAFGTSVAPSKRSEEPEAKRNPPNLERLTVVSFRIAV